MKKIIVMVGIILATVLMFSVNVFAIEKDAISLELELAGNKKSNNINIYLLLPKDYIMYVIENDNLFIRYEGVDTLIKNTIPSIDVDKENVEKEIYTENDTEYVQILLKENDKNKYVFDILSSYNKMTMKFKIQNNSVEYVAHIDNFKIEDGKCVMVYDYDNNTIKQPDKLVGNKKSYIFVIVLVIILIIVVISYSRQRG